MMRPILALLLLPLASYGIDTVHLTGREAETVQLARNSGYFVAGIAEKAGKPTVNGLQVGDKLIQVDDVCVSAATRGAIFAALHGEPGSVRLLVIERGGQQLKVPAKVTTF
jgi:PDZ domain-containing protein